ncbi:hypothetical protein [Streptomyces sp. NPDC048172]|uniref:hypothetical protein n=1 Tax=Streptomyces sp. NPDC048172 TaxID=3365505 RepID=UPI00371D5236
MASRGGILVLGWVVEGVAGSAATWAFAHMGEDETLWTLVAVGAVMALTALVVESNVLAVALLLGLLGFTIPLVGATYFEGRQGKPITSVVKDEPGSGTTVGNTVRNKGNSGGPDESPSLTNPGPQPSGPPSEPLPSSPGDGL